MKTALFGLQCEFGHTSVAILAAELSRVIKITSNIR